MGKVPVIDSKTLEQHASKKSCWVTRRGKVYDLTEFAADHPGGSELIHEYGGRDVDDIMKDGDSHEHSESAYEMLEEFVIGVLHKDGDVESQELQQLDPMADLESDEYRPSHETDVQQDFSRHHFLDLSKPLLMQVWHAKFKKEFYLEQVHRPRHLPHGKSARIFTWTFLEPLSLTPWYVVPMFWVPLVVYLMHEGCKQSAYPVQWFAFGMFLWTFVEYLIHRFLFHIDAFLPDHPAFLTLHFLLHGVHHYTPLDRMRLVLPPALFVILSSPFFKLAHFLFPYHTANVVMAGGITGYLLYDMFHYSSHHAPMPWFLTKAKSYHLAHHYKNFDRGFGVSPPAKLWDYVFGTTLVVQDDFGSRLKLQ